MLKKNKEKIFNLIGILAIFTYFFSMIITKETTNLDELWNYNIARNIAKGLVPYKDISMITTPLLPLIEAIILKISINELFTFRILNAVLITVIISTTYIIYTKLGVNKITSCIFVLFQIWIFKDEVFLDYNFFILFLSLLIIIIELNSVKRESSSKEQLFIGLLAGLVFCTKQTIGALILCITIAIPFIINCKKREIKSCGYRLIGALIPIIIMLIYLVITGAFYDFLSYTFLAINTFSNSISYLALFYSGDITTIILAIINPIIIIGTGICIIWEKNKYKDKFTHKEIEKLFIYAIPLLIIQYPIADRVHFIISNYITMILAGIIAYTLLKKLIKKTPKDVKAFFTTSTKAFFIIGGMTYIIICTKTNTTTYLNTEKNTELQYYNKLIVPEYIKKQYYELRKVEEEFENEGKKVNLLDSNAVVVHIPMDKYVKHYDMFNKGNFGKDGEDGIIQTIKESPKQVYLIKKSSIKKNWQNPSKITDFIEKNLKKIGETEIYNIYEK